MTAIEHVRRRALGTDRNRWHPKINDWRMMKRSNRLLTIGSALTCGAALTISAYAGGIMLYEIATPDVGPASAGCAARAQDPSTFNQ